MGRRERDGRLGRSGPPAAPALALGVGVVGGGLDDERVEAGADDVEQAVESNKVAIAKRDGMLDRWANAIR